MILRFSFQLPKTLLRESLKKNRFELFTFFSRVPNKRLKGPIIETPLSIHLCLFLSSGSISYTGIVRLLKFSQTMYLYFTKYRHLNKMYYINVKVKQLADHKDGWPFLLPNFFFYAFLFSLFRTLCGASLTGTWPVVNNFCFGGDWINIFISFFPIHFKITKLILLC